MRKIRAKDTKPELIVRSLVHGLGYRYRLHAKDLPGKPDLVFRSRMKVIFVHGCFWHQHSSSNCSKAQMPNSNREYWGKKLKGNVNRDRKNTRELEKLGFNILTVWECECSDKQQLTERLMDFLQD